MSYLAFLILFVITPGIGLVLLVQQYLDGRWWRSLAALCILAVVWTTPWDNYLVATNVWWYDPDLVLGIVIGYVPIEEYAFFILQTLMTGMLVVGLWHWLPPKADFKPLPPFSGMILVGPLALLSLLLFATEDERFNYLLLEIGWLALLPFTTQWLWGMDIIWHYWRVALPAILIPTLWLTSMDAIAISAGTWTIDPAQTVGLKFGGIVPVEEGIFFLITNVLIVQGLILFYSPESWARFTSLGLPKKLNNKALEDHPNLHD